MAKEDTGVTERLHLRAVTFGSPTIELELRRDLGWETGGKVWDATGIRTPGTGSFRHFYHKRRQNYH